MKKRLVFLLLAAFIIFTLAVSGCKGRAQNAVTEPRSESTDIVDSSLEVQPPIQEPAQTVATETIPPTAAPQLEQKVGTVVEQGLDRNKQIQIALKNAGLYAGAIDGKIGPKTKQAIQEFQRSKGLKVDGVVGPRTWSELEKYLVQQ